MTLTSAYLATIAIVLVSGVEAQARYRAPIAPPSAYDGDVPEGYLPELSAATGQLCVKQCPADSLPCDPPSFKVADGRCTTQWR